ncbi:hypothetical protein DUI87_32608 [Hirundo rustica rustica]|uniref:Uncharacterized protein n=1 Tax=Hirundo rustica rustica TaxID=333673 RepID=A0A3M0IT37_HIRRU|nr:hypothetical protein DUI87_32608 [Hirundo rustica rustica]
MPEQLHGPLLGTEKIVRTPFEAFELRFHLVGGSKTREAARSGLSERNLSESGVVLALGKPEENQKSGMRLVKIFSSLFDTVFGNKRYLISTLQIRSTIDFLSTQHQWYSIELIEIVSEYLKGSFPRVDFEGLGIIAIMQFGMICGDAEKGIVVNITRNIRAAFSLVIANNWREEGRGAARDCHQEKILVQPSGLGQKNNRTQNVK